MGKEKERNIAIFAIIIGTGASTQEVVNLTVRDIDMRKKEFGLLEITRNSLYVFSPSQFLT